MMGANIKKIQANLNKLPGVEVDEIKIENNIIKHIAVQTLAVGKLVIESIDIKDSTKLFNFYFQGLSEKARNFFPPYPLFSPSPKDSKELAEKIKNWQQEDDWTVLKLLKDGQIIGMCLLKKYKTDNPTSGLAVSEKFQKMGLGALLQTIINEQARLLRIKKLTITLAQNNMASLKVHKKTGFKKTGRLVPHYIYINGVKTKDRDDIEMVKEIS